MRVVALVAGLVLVTSSCTGTGSEPTASGRGGSEAQPTTSPTTAPAHEKLEIGARTPTDGWIVMADGFGVHVAGGGTIQSVDPQTGLASKARRIGTWDYDFTHLGRIGEGSLWLASGHDLWLIGGSPRYAVGRRYDFPRLGYLGSVYDARWSAGGGTWIAATGDRRPGGVLAELDPNSGSITRSFALPGGPGTITDAGGFIVAQTGHGVLRINPRTGRETTRRFVVAPRGIAATRDRIWWTSSGGAVGCLLVRTLTDCGTIHIPRAGLLSSDGHRLWVLGTTGSRKATTYVPDPSQPATVTLVNGATGEVLAGPLALSHFTPASLTSYDGHAWVGFHDAQDVVRVDRSR